MYPFAIVVWGDVEASTVLVAVLEQSHLQYAAAVTAPPASVTQATNFAVPVLQLIASQHSA